MLVIFSCEVQNVEKVDVLLRNVQILDIESGSIIENKIVVIKDGIIYKIIPEEFQDRFLATNAVDADGGFVMPGLWDNHVHFRGGATLIAEYKNLLPLFLYHGVTTVRDAGGDITPAVLEWKRQIIGATLTGPTIYTSGPKLDGEKPAWAGSIAVTNKEEVSEALDSLQNIGIDYVKIYDGSISKEMFYEIIKQSESRDLNVTGHMPLSADIEEAASYGLDGTEHMYYVLKSCSPKKDSLTEANPGYGMMNTILDTYDSALATQVFEELGTKDFYITPTLYIGKILANLADEDHSNDYLLPYIGEGIQKTYERRIQSAIRAKERGNNMRNRLGEVAMKTIVPMKNAGINILAGSDCGPYNSFVYPGHSLHKELKLLVASGLTPKEAIQTSITNGVKFFSAQDIYGSVTEGKHADLLILQQNPMADIENLESIAYVVKNGELYSKKMLEGMLKK
jgi:imidazolonepropionase-like amidohydrolase